MSKKTIIVLPNDFFFTEVKKCLQEDKLVEIVVQGNSMRPFLNNGERILLKSIKNRALKTGDIVLAEFDSGYVLHRIVKKRKEYFVLAGDGNLSQKEQVTGESAIAFIPISSISRIAGLAWYFLRPLRCVVHKIYNYVNRLKKKRR